MHCSSAQALVGAPALFRRAAAPTDDAPQPGQTFSLTGIAGNDEARVALLRDDADQNVFRVRVGEDIRGWRLASLDDRCATLTHARQRQTMCLS